MTILYIRPSIWIRYDPQAILQPLTEAKAAILALTQMPYQRSWVDELQKLQLKREVAGTSRIEGAEFTEKELDAALWESPEQLETRSQRQAAAAVSAYRWIAGLDADRPVDLSLVLEVHRRMVSGCDEDHCPPGELRGRDQNVTFGAPRHRGVEGGDPCREALEGLVDAARTVFREHDPLIQALALHYHFAAMHPFLDGNGRTARALEALMLQREGLRDTMFIAMSNYYYEEKTGYLRALGDTRAGEHNLTPFLCFALKGIAIQSRRLFSEIRHHLAKALYRNTVNDLFGRLQSPRKRVMSERNVKVLNLLLDEGPMTLDRLIDRTRSFYNLKNPQKAVSRDLEYLVRLGALIARRTGEEGMILKAFTLECNLEWPTQITETEFFRRAKELPKGKTHGFLLP